MLDGRKQFFDRVQFIWNGSDKSRNFYWKEAKYRFWLFHELFIDLVGFCFS